MHQLIDRQMRQLEQAGNILHLVAQIRLDHPTMSCRAMYYKLRPLPIGRDAFEVLCISHGYRSGRLKALPRTTNSIGVIRFDNLFKGLRLTHIDQVWSSDITYFEVGGHFYYLTFILDCYSRVIVGYSVSKSLTTEQTVIASLKMAIKRRNSQLVIHIIFHSDGGGQYYAKEFLEITRQYNFLNSMCEYPWENNKSERLNGIIKNNYLNHWSIKNFEELQKQVDRAVCLYNQGKPHKSLGYMTPESFESKWLHSQQQTSRQ